MEMTDINNLRRLALGGELSTILEILNRLELAEKGRDELRVAVCREGDRADAYQMDVIILRTKLAQLYKEADKFDDGIDWIQRALQAEAKIEAMDIAAANGADSRSMPDEYVEVAVWLCGIPSAKGEEK